MFIQLISNFFFFSQARLKVKIMWLFEKSMVVSLGVQYWPMGI